MEAVYKIRMEVLVSLFGHAKVKEALNNIPDVYLVDDDCGFLLGYLASEYNLWCKTMGKPKSDCNCPNCGSSLVDIPKGC